MKFIALKTCDGGAKGRISFCCKALKVTRQGFHDYLKNRNKPWKHEELTAKMMEILSEDECNDTYGRERMHKALLLKYPDSGIPSEATVYRVMTAIGITHRPNRKPNGITKAGNYGDTGFAAEVLGFSGDIHRFRPGVPLLDAVQRGAVLSEVQHFDEHYSVKHYLVP